MKHLEIVEIKNEYIERLRKTFSHVMINKGDYNTHTRKYIGVILKIKKMNYYAPFSSPKSYDFTEYGKPKDSNYFVLRMIDSDKEQKKLIGKILINCMIPVPYRCINKININKINDKNYKNLLLSEFQWINKNQTLIQKIAENVYKIYNNKKVLPFKKIEKYVKNHYKS